MKRSHLKTIISVLALAVTLSSNASARVYEYELKNGLKLLVKQDNRAPIVVTQVWYKVGNVDEHLNDKHLQLLDSQNQYD